MSHSSTDSHRLSTKNNVSRVRAASTSRLLNRNKKTRHCQVKRKLPCQAPPSRVSVATHSSLLVESDRMSGVDDNVYSAENWFMSRTPTFLPLVPHRRVWHLSGSHWTFLNHSSTAIQKVSSLKFLSPTTSGNRRRLTLPAEPAMLARTSILHGRVPGATIIKVV